MCLIGSGASPGIANMLAVVAGRELDTVDRLITGWNIAAAHPEQSHSGGVSAAMVHVMEQISGTIPVTRGGQLVHRPALEKVTFDYPGLGTFHTRSIGHPEAVTLRRAFPELRDNVNVCVGDKFTMATLSSLRRLIDKGALTLDRAGAALDRLFGLLPTSPTDFLKPGSPPPLFAVATGTRQGRPGSAATALAQVPGFSMAAATGVPLAVTALLMKASRRPGTHPMETLIDPDAFFAALAPHCFGDPSPKHMTATTTSWAPDERNRQAFGTSLLTALLHAGRA
ncbi:hypothetical protein J7F01_15085 [Streptomyces sp. ISL-22]|uniref:hypothetical protein n=1 Tax=unclassified Streptomyces TaxID=2593676 RepID=UPI001BE90A3A|nr:MULTISPECIES: hypothetical protein [unclassified Streptomyces]MBT2423774.1 hypothetical protein [Streptomyces sp. ISL-24]MBT2433494.1 hypothetical protein [Streptomyces sp. ISL-22]